MQWSAPRVGSRAMTDRSAALEIANQYRRAMPDRIRRYLNRRGIPDTVIELHLVGWNGERITIPIRDGVGRVLFFKLAKDPDDKGPGPKMLAPLGSVVALYGWERLRVKPYSATTLPRGASIFGPGPLSSGSLASLKKSTRPTPSRIGMVIRSPFQPTR